MGIRDLNILKEPEFTMTSVRQDRYALEEALRSEHRQGKHGSPAKPLVNCPLCRVESKEKDGG